jgi:hypothetical protein
MIPPDPSKENPACAPMASENDREFQWNNVLRFHNGSQYWGFLLTFNMFNALHHRLHRPQASIRRSGRFGATGEKKLPVQPGERARESAE